MALSIAHLQIQLDDIERKVDSLSERLLEKINELYNHVDGFIVLHQRLDIEFVALLSKQRRLEERVEQLEIDR